MSTCVDPAVHGALDFAELERLGFHPDDVLDFSVNSNPFCPSPLVWDTIRSTPLERYPDRESIALRRALSKQFNVSFEPIVVGNGTAELIQLAAFAFLQKGENVLTAEPAFGEYERSVRLMNANVSRWRATPEDGFACRSDEIQKKLDGQKIRMMYLCNPNNPTGQAWPLDALNEWTRPYPETLLIVDEAHLAFVTEMKSAASLQRKNILTLRSMIKDYAIAGLSLGYAIGDESIIEALTNLRPAWNVNAQAQVAGRASVLEETYLIETLAKLRDEKEVLISGLKELGYACAISNPLLFIAR